MASRWGDSASGPFAFGGRADGGPAAAGAPPVTWWALLLAFSLGATSATMPLHAASAAPLVTHAGAAWHGAQLHLPPGAVLFASPA